MGFNPMILFKYECWTLADMLEFMFLAFFYFEYIYFKIKNINGSELHVDFAI